jgi:hypothetical protein
MHEDEFEQQLWKKESTKPNWPEDGYSGTYRKSKCFNPLKTKN